MAKHENSGDCPKCNEILKNAHPDLVKFAKAEQKRDPEVHVCWSTRNKAEQEQAFNENKSKAHYGESPHNYTPSLAIDFFFVINGNASWIFSRFQALAKRKPKGIIWGADWNDDGNTADEKFKDSPHFELKDWKKLAKNYPNGTA